MNDEKETKKIEVEVPILKRIEGRMKGIELNLEINNHRLGDVEKIIDKLSKKYVVLEVKGESREEKINELESDVKPVKAIKAAWKVPLVRKIFFSVICAFIILVLFAGGENLYNFLKNGLIKILGI